MTDGLATRFLFSLLFSLCACTALAADPPIPETTPPRLSLSEGAVSFWRPGAEDWTAAQVNTALAAGDRLYADEDANLELQIGARAFVRAGEKTQIGIANIEPDFLQVEVTTGQASIDVRELDAGHTIEVGTPNAAFTIEHTGYYRVNVNGDTTTFITRRSGRALVTPAGGRAGAISPSEQVVVQGQTTPTVETYVAPDLDEWDRWNYARTDRLLDSMSARYVSPGVAGTADLDHYGSWRVVPTYGPVWIPRGVARGWAPYSNGRWIMDPYYGWTWIDYAPWGWAPYHYGRWVYLDSYWGWAPGPVGVRTAYAPALVAFFGGDDWSVGLNLGGPAIGWFALGWGEPCYPWWGPSWYRYRPWWGGWHGHHHWHHKHHDHDHHGDHDDDDDFHGDRDDDHHGIDDYDNARVPRAVSAERAEDFGRHGGGERRGRIDQFDGSGVEPIRGSIPARATPASLTPGAGGSGATRPPAATENRPVVATRAPRDPSRGLRNAGIPATSAPKTSPTRMVPAPPKGGRSGDSPQVSRPPFGTRGGNERQEPPAPPPYRGSGGSTRTSTGKPILVQPRASGSSPAMRPSSRPSSRPLTQPHVQPQAQPPSRPSLPYRSSSGSVSPRPQSAPSPSRSAPSSVGSASSRARPSPSVRTAPAPSPTSRSSSSGSGTYSSQQRSGSSVHSTPSPSGIGRSGSSLPGVPANRVFRGSGGTK